MSQDNQHQQGCSDAKADAVAAVALVAIAMTTIIYWLSSF